jgi:hypothetical protein
MKHHDHFHCPVCGEQFDMDLELKQHQRHKHEQQGVSGGAPSNEFPLPDAAAPSTRKNKEFTRRHSE